MSNDNLHFFGIRHHGSGSARSLLSALQKLAPDILLVEAPPDAEKVLSLAFEADMQPPVALLSYVVDNPRIATYFPFAVFSPEWQAIQYAFTKNIEVRFMDLPQTNSLALLLEEENQHQLNLFPEPNPDELAKDIQQDPLGTLAKIAGYSDGERWWNDLVEQANQREDVFTGILEAMTALRENIGLDNLPPREQLREAHMRKTIYKAQTEGFERIAIVCGAWHTPALLEMPPAKQDNALLRGLPKVKIRTTWIPWTYSRLSMVTGYGAGIVSPGWYHHLWENPNAVAITWMSRVAHLLRAEDLDASPSQIIDAVRLAETLASIRGRRDPSLEDLNEATRAVLTQGSNTPLQLISKKLIVGEVIGSVPAQTPLIPLQKDVESEQKRLRMKLQSDVVELELDLRKERDREKSWLLHRLNLLKIKWGHKQEVSGTLGTFKEQWTLWWQPEFVLQIIEASQWGNTLLDATTNCVQSTAQNSLYLPELTQLIHDVLFANLPEIIPVIVEKLQEKAALSSDVQLLMQSVPPLVDVMSYGNVRKTDVSAVEVVVDGMITRIMIGLPNACASLDDAAAEELLRILTLFNSALRQLQQADYLQQWFVTLLRLLQNVRLHGSIAGRSCRILLDAQEIDFATAVRYLRLAISTANEPNMVASWVDGFLRNSGIVLFHDDDLLRVIDEWLLQLNEEQFVALLPLLRRTFATFSTHERRQIGTKIKDENLQKPTIDAELQINQERANQILPILAELLGNTSDLNDDDY